MESEIFMMVQCQGEGNTGYGGHKRKTEKAQLRTG
jgi:hypothetical protein